MKIPGIRPIPGYITELRFPKGGGLRSFFKQLERFGVIKSVPSGSLTRRCNAIWNIISERGYKTGFIGWCCTWPAEKVNGFLVSQYAFPYELIIGKKVSSLANRTYPEGLMEELKSAIVGKEMTRDGFKEQLNVPVDLLPDKYFPWTFAKDETYYRMSRILLEKHKDLSLFGIYFSGIDASCHQWWPFLSEAPSAAILRTEALSHFETKQTSELQSILRSIIERCYVYMDRRVGQLLKFTSEADLVIVVSDHGFNFDGTLHIDAPDGIIILSGNMINKKGIFQQPPTVFDITPTVLWTLSLPVARDMDGRVLKDVFTSSWISMHPLKTVGSYEKDEKKSHAKSAPGMDEGIKERLKSLGYI
jgi:hypothetical protein